MNLLLVEDNSAHVFLLRELFQETSNVPRMTWVSDGQEALDYIFQREEHSGALRPDVVLLDLGLPRVTGYEVLRMIRDDRRSNSIPVIILSTSLDPADRLLCEALGAQGYFSKPFDLEGYEQLVRQLVEVEFPRVTTA